MLLKAQPKQKNSNPEKEEIRGRQGVAFFKKALRKRGYKVGFSTKTEEILLRKESRGTVVARFSRSKLEKFFATF